MATETLAAILNTMVARYGLGRRGTNSGTSASQITDAVSLKGDELEGIEAGCQILITGPADDDRAGEISNLSTKPVYNTGVAKVVPDFGGALDDNDTYIILYKPLRWEGGGMGVIDAVNWALSEFKWVKRMVPITLVPDGDMLAISPTTDWGTASSGTPTKVAASFPSRERWLNFEASGVGGYALSKTIDVEPGKSYYLEVTGRLVTTASGDAGTLALSDETNSTAITVPDNDITRQEPTILTNTITMPATCEQVSIRLTSTGADDDLQWANLIFRKLGEREFTLTDRPQTPFTLGRLMKYPSDVWGQRGEAYEIPSRPREYGAGIWSITTDEAPTGSLWYEEFVSPASVAVANVDTDTIEILGEHVAAVAAEKLLSPLKNRDRVWNDRYLIAADAARGVIDGYLSRNQVVVTAPSPAKILIRRT